MIQLVKNPPVILKTWFRPLHWEDHLKKGKSTPPYSGWENSTDCIVYGVAESWTQVSNFHFTSLSLFLCGCLLLKYNWPTTPCKFLLHNTMIQYFHTFQNDHHYKSNYNEKLYFATSSPFFLGIHMTLIMTVLSVNCKPNYSRILRKTDIWNISHGIFHSMKGWTCPVPKFTGSYPRTCCGVTDVFIFGLFSCVCF